MTVQFVCVWSSSLRVVHGGSHYLEYTNILNLDDSVVDDDDDGDDDYNWR